MKRCLDLYTHFQTKVTNIENCSHMTTLTTTTAGKITDMDVFTQWGKQLDRDNYSSTKTLNKTEYTITVNMK